MSVCAVLATFVDRVIREGRVPEVGFADCVTTPILKASKPGQPRPDAADPNNNRNITGSALLAKLASLVLIFRLTLGSATRPDQPRAGHLPARPQRRVTRLSFTQLIRSRARHGETTRVLFVDLSKAYNFVSLPSLWHLLREMGVPDLILTLLDDWASKRRTRLRVNGKRTD
jgi:hypothetical protein